MGELLAGAAVAGAAGSAGGFGAGGSAVPVGAAVGVVGSAGAGSVATSAAWASAAGVAAGPVACGDSFSVGALDGWSAGALLHPAHATSPRITTSTTAAKLLMLLLLSAVVQLDGPILPSGRRGVNGSPWALELPMPEQERPSAVRERLPDERQSITHHFVIRDEDGEVDCYLTVGLYEDGRPGEVFAKMGKEGQAISGLLDGWAIGMSIALQYGIPLEVFVSKLSGMAFSPSGYSGNREIGYAKSVLDYIVRWMALRFGSAETRASVPPGNPPKCPRCGAQQQRDDHGIFCPGCGYGGRR